MTVPTPNIIVGEEVMAVEEDNECWTTPIIKFLKDGTCKVIEETIMKPKCARYTLIGEELY